MKSNLFKMVRPFISKHEPELLMTMGISGMLFSVIWGVKATNEAVKRINTKKTELGRDKLTTQELVKETWKLYLPVVISTVISVPCIIAGNRVANRRNLALAAAYTISETALQEYQEKTKEIIGDKKYEKLQESISADKVSAFKDGVTKVTMIGDGESLFYEPLSGRYFKTSWNRIAKAANELNAKALSNMFGVTTLGEWFDILGLEPTKLDDTLGWSTADGRDGIIDICVDSIMTKDNIPCGAIRYDTMPRKI